MMYTFSGQFSAALGPVCSEPLAGVTVRLYKYRGMKYVSSLAVVDPQTTMTLLSADTVSAKASSLLTEASTDADGKFVLTLEEGQGYHGEAFDLDIALTSVPGRTDPKPHWPLQFTLTTLKPRWVATEQGQQATWEYCLPADFWQTIRARFDAWTICGQVVRRTTHEPLSNVQVTAFDADWLQDDRLGSAHTDAEGRFRIDYARADFTRTPLSPLLNREEGGPDIYFTLESSTGVSLLQEPKAYGYTPGRKDVEPYVFVELAV
jgi:5-hydroxyisourate hydrolase-like protein (transthyretin family)